MKKNISRNPLWPDWYNGKKIDEVQFGRAFLEQWPLKCVNGTLYTLDGPVEDESEIKQRILENIEEYVTSSLSKKVINILETIKLLAFSDPFPIEQDCIHLQNGVYHLPDGSFQESRLFCQNRLPVKYDPKAANPERWFAFLHELLDDADIPTLQEYLGYCLIPSTKGQKMMLIVGKGGKGKSRIGLVLKRLMGDAANNGSVQKVENNRFARADLERRLLMIDNDMDKLRPYHIEALYDTLSKTPCGQYVGGKRRDLSPKQQKRTLSGTTLHEVHQLLHNSFLLAVEPVLIRKKFLKWQDAHPEFEKIVFHGLRHSSATYQLMISGGDVKAVQGTTGHASADMLVNTYAHIQQSSRVELGKKFESGFYAKPDTPSPQANPPSP
ncbi:tyrosine-type recombinase/integrase [Faecalibacterium prausnitzii]|uniref:tyrosine-type recombinase/integrase n=1 Tax=Faecalibacterium prausnitzii TaxID=853 RepID=UPI001FA9E7E2|nr:tyrosine-type recombinase/integrase [Faecalibacterium prausnitzii]